MIYHVVTIRDYKSRDEFEIGTTENVNEAQQMAKEEINRILRDNEKYESVEIRVYEDEELQLDYDTVGRWRNGVFYRVDEGYRIYKQFDQSGENE